MVLQVEEKRIENLERYVGGIDNSKDLEKFIWLLENRKYDFRPVGLKEFCISEEYLDLRDEVWKCTMEDLEEIEKRKCREVVLEGAPGGGKSFEASILGVYAVYRMLCYKDPQKEWGFARGSELYFMNMGINELNAKKVIFGEMKTRIDNSPWFMKYYPYNPDIQSRLEFDSDKKKISIVPGNSKMSFPLGFNLFGCIMDDCAWYIESSESMDVAEEMYLTLNKRITRRFPGCSFSYMMMVSNPKYKDSYIETKQKESVVDKKIYAIRRPIWKSKPWMYSGKTFKYDGRDIPIEHKEEYDRNPELSQRDLEAMPSSALMPFFKSMNNIFSCVSRTLHNNVDGKNRIRKDFVPVEGAKYYAHIDLAYNKCSAGLAMVHWTSVKRIRTDLLMRFCPLELGGEIVFEDLREYLYQLTDMKFDIKKVTLDGFQSIDTLQILRKRGYDCEILSMDRTDVPYETYKEQYNTGTIELCNVEYDNPRIYTHPVTPEEWLIKELKNLEKVRTKIDHPLKGSKDISDAHCGAVYNAVEAKGKSGNRKIRASVL